MNYDKVIPLQCGSVRFQDQTLAPFPRFEITGNTLLCSHTVHTLLHSDDIFAVIWRGKIRPPVLNALRQYRRDYAAMALILAQSNPVRFVDWTSWNPAIIESLIHWSTEGLDGWRLTPQETWEVFSSNWKTILTALDLPPTRAFLRLLSKIPINEYSPENINGLKAAFSYPQKGRLASHLKLINTAVIDVLQLPFRYLSVDLLNRVAADKRIPTESSVRELCLEIHEVRIQRYDHYNWPFRGERVSLKHLANYLEKLQRELMFGPNADHVELPPPPVKSLDSPNIKVEALTTIGEIYHESVSQDNCLQTYARSISCGHHYAYRLLRPERATVLLLKRFDEIWAPAQIRTAGNGDPRPETITAVEAWLGANLQFDLTEDAPF